MKALLKSLKRIAYWVMKDMFMILVAATFGGGSLYLWNNIYLSLFLAFVAGYLYIGYQVSFHGKGRGEQILFFCNIIAIGVMAISGILGFVFGQIAIGIIAVFILIFLLLLQGLYEFGKAIEARESYLRSMEGD